MSCNGTQVEENDRFYPDPDSDLDYDINWATTFLQDGEVIVDAEWIVSDGISTHDSSHTDTRTVIWVTGGEVDAEYQVTTRITTNQGRVEDKTQYFTPMQH